MAAKNTTRRVSVIAGLVLLPALVFGGAASAEGAADGGRTDSRPGHGQTVDRPDEVRVAVQGKISDIEKRGDVKWGEVTVLSIVSQPGDPAVEVVLTPRTVLELEDGAPEIGDDVEAIGKPVSERTILGEHVIVR